MPTIRLEFDLDSEVYPELHAALAGLTSVRARGERIRQLATAGLVWENVRIHGAAAIGPSPRAEATALASGAAAPRRGGSASTSPSAHVPDGPAVAAAPASPPVRRSPARAKASPAAPAHEPVDPDFIDLAINAVPAPPAERRRSRTAPRLAEYVERELPVLRDIVAEESVTVEPAVPPAAIPPVLADGHHARRPDDLARHPVEAEEHGSPVEVPEGATHLPSLALKPASRSRLMRMKEKGLFKNG